MGIWTLIALAVAAPAVLVALVPRRWLGWTILLWVLAPVLAYGGAVLWDAAAGEAGPDPVSSAALALLLMATFVGLPWLLACAAGVLIGLLLRRRRSDRA